LYSPWIVLATRCLLVVLFLPFSALDKIFNFRQAVGQCAQAVPVPALASLMIVMALGLEITMSLAIITGIADRLAALVLALYCVLTALLWKPFWKAPDFRLRGSSHGRDMFWDFLKNLSLAGGFLMLALGTDGAAMAHFVAHPLQSSHPYAVPGADGAS